MILAITCAALVLVAGTAFAVTRNGGPGDDTLVGTDHSDWLDGKRGNDLVSGLSGGDLLLVGGFGNDVVTGGKGDDDLSGGALRCVKEGPEGGPFFLFCRELDDHGSDTVSGGPGDDSVNGSFGPDVLSGGAGDDSLVDPGDNLGGNVISGGDGNDTIQSIAEGRKPVKDVINCGSGRDEVEADYKDLIAPNCEQVARFRPGQG